MTQTRETLTQDMPTLLPDGEQPLWRGGPNGHLLARQALHVKKAAVYFALLLGWRLLMVARDGFTLSSAIDAAVTTLALGTVVVAALYGFAIWSARNTSYTITSERIVIRTGIALSVTINLPFKTIANVDMRHTQPRSKPTAGDLVLSLAEGSKAAYVILWPNAKPLRFFRTQPMLRALDNVDIPAAIISDALLQHAQRNEMAGSVSAIDADGASGNKDAGEFSLATS